MDDQWVTQTKNSKKFLVQCLHKNRDVHLREICFPFCIQPGLSPARRTVIIIIAHQKDVGFFSWKKFCSLIYSTLEKERAIFLSALGNSGCGVEMQFHYSVGSTRGPPPVRAGMVFEGFTSESL